MLLLHAHLHSCQCLHVQWMVSQVLAKCHSLGAVVPRQQQDPAWYGTGGQRREQGVHIRHVPSTLLIEWEGKSTRCMTCPDKALSR